MRGCKTKSGFIPEPRKFCQRGSNSATLTTLFFLYFLVDEGRGDPNTTESGPSSVCHSLAGRWWPIIVCWVDSVDFQGIRTSIAKTPITLSFFGGGGLDPLSTLDPRIGFLANRITRHTRFSCDKAKLMQNNSISLSS